MSRKLMIVLLGTLLLEGMLSPMVHANDPTTLNVSPTSETPQLLGPQQTKIGTLAVFEVVPAQNADWTITPEIDASILQRHQVDTSTSRLYFATPNVGEYTIVAAIIVDGRPQILTQTVLNGKQDTIKPQPTPTPSPTPNQTFIEWLNTQRSELVKSRNVDAESKLVAQCFAEVTEKIETGVIKSPQNARSQLQIVLMLQLAETSPTAINDWIIFLAELSKKIETELGEKIDDIDALKNIFRVVAGTLVKSEIKSMSTAANTANCPECQKNNPPQYQRAPVTRKR